MGKPQKRKNKSLSNQEDGKVEEEDSKSQKDDNDETEDSKVSDKQKAD